MGAKVKEFMKEWAESTIKYWAIAVLMFVIELIHVHGGR